MVREEFTGLKEHRGPVTEERDPSESPVRGSVELERLVHGCRVDLLPVVCLLRDSPTDDGTLSKRGGFLPEQDRTHDFWTESRDVDTIDKDRPEKDRPIEGHDHLPNTPSPPPVTVVTGIEPRMTRVGR